VVVFLDWAQQGGAVPTVFVEEFDFAVGRGIVEKRLLLWR
jgi:hypothetical protein